MRQPEMLISKLSLRKQYANEMAVVSLFLSKYDAGGKRGH